MLIMWVSGKPQQKPFLQTLDYKWETPETQLSICVRIPYLLLEWDLLAKMNTKIIFAPGQMDIKVLLEEACTL